MVGNRFRTPSVPAGIKPGPLSHFMPTDTQGVDVGSNPTPPKFGRVGGPSLRTLTGGLMSESETANRSILGPENLRECLEQAELTAGKDRHNF